VNTQDDKLAADLKAVSPYEAVLEGLKQQARDGMKGSVGDGRAVELDTFIRSVTAEYAPVLGMTELEVLSAIEKRRDYSAVNYYQRANFPSLKSVRMFETRDDFRAAIPSKTFRCPSCKGASHDPQDCDTGIKDKDGNACNWKSYGFLGTLGAGASIVIKADFLEDGRVYEIFMPTDFEKTAEPAAQ